MSHHSGYYASDPANGVTAADNLKNLGPRLSIVITIPDVLVKALAVAGITVQPQAGFALIDTGASKSMVDETVVKSLSVNPITKKEVITPQGTDWYNLYPAKFLFPGTNLPDIDFNSVFSSQHLKEKQGIIALIGRDILQYSVFSYNGDGHFSLSLNPNKSTDKGSIVGLTSHI